jgi:SulP family sulfate permease
METQMKNFRFTLAEFSGSLADLGVMLPLVLALISLNGMNAISAFVGIGLAYMLTAIVYRLPIPVQPLKSVSAVALSMGLAPAVIITGAIWNAIAFLGMGLIGLDKWVHKAFPKPVVRGIQLGLAYLLFKSAWKLVTTQNTSWKGGFKLSEYFLSWNLVLVAGTLVVLIIFMRWKKDWAALGVILFGLGISLYHIGLPSLTLGFNIPHLFPLVPTWQQLWQGFLVLALPQIPLSLGNSVYATTDAAQQYFAERATRVTPRRLMITMGINDTIATIFGGIPVCHGCGGLTAHYRLGARTGGAPLIIGFIFLSLGLFGGTAIMNIFSFIPFAVLGVLLAYVGWQHAFLIKDLRGWREILTALLVLALTIPTGNLAVGFLSAAVFYYLWGWFDAILHHRPTQAQ